MSAPPPDNAWVQLGFWLDADLARRFRRHCAAEHLRIRVAAQEAIALYLDVKHPRAGALDVAGGLSSISPPSAPGREFDSRDGDDVK